MNILTKKLLATSALVFLMGISGCKVIPNGSFINKWEATTISRGTDPETLVVALLPDRSNSTSLRNHKGLKKYLEQELGKKVELFISTDYSSMIKATNRGRFDLANFGPISYVVAKAQSNIEPFAILEKQGKTNSQSVVIANVNQPINSIADIAEKTMAYGDPASTASHLVPKSMLLDQGLAANIDYQEVFLGSHSAVALAVQNNQVQAGGLNKAYLQAMIDNKQIDPAKIKILADSKPFPEHPWTMRSDLSPELKDKIRSTFLNLKDKDVLKPFKSDGFASVEDKDFDLVRYLTPLVNIDLAKLGKEQ